MADPVLPPQLGRYRLLRKLGEGGMGTVYLAEDTLLSCSVALKVPHFSEADNSTVIERFRREARAATGLEHPNICPVHDVGQVGGVYYLVMPYVEGTPLSRLCRGEEPVPLERAVALVRRAAEAVAVLHRRGIIHRDLKPGNIMIRPDGEPVLMDFGLARSFISMSRRLTATGTGLGTPAYVSP